MVLYALFVLYFLGFVFFFLNVTYGLGKRREMIRIEDKKIERKVKYCADQVCRDKVNGSRKRVLARG